MICIDPNVSRSCLHIASVDLWNCGTVEKGASCPMAECLMVCSFLNGYESCVLYGLITQGAKTLNMGEIERKREHNFPIPMTYNI